MHTHQVCDENNQHIILEEFLAGDLHLSRSQCPHGRHPFRPLGRIDDFSAGLKKQERQNSQSTRSLAGMRVQPVGLNPFSTLPVKSCLMVDATHATLNLNLRNHSTSNPCIRAMSYESRNM